MATPAHLDLARRAQGINELTEQVLKLCVQQCRDAGHTWQEIGDLLGVTRQAAFQRFGKPIDPFVRRIGDQSSPVMGQS